MDLSILIFAAQFLFGILLADFISGVLHWAEDRYGEPDWPLVGEAIRETIGHHTTPMAITGKTFLQLNGRVLLIACVLGLLFLLAGLPATTVFAAFLFGGFSNQIHCWAHMRPKALPGLVRLVQWTGLFQPFLHHAGHHRGDKDTRYCVVTSWLNPLLDRLHFWTRLEGVIFRLTGLVVRHEPSAETAAGVRS